MRQPVARCEKASHKKIFLEVLFVMAGGSRFTGDRQAMEGNSNGITQLLRCGKKVYSQ